MTVDNEMIYILAERYSLYSAEFKEHKYYLFDISDGTQYKLNEVSYAILASFDGQKTCSQVYQTLQEIYDVSNDRLKSDYETLLTDCLDKGILRERNESNERKEA